jgi:hypothetical protein
MHAQGDDVDRRVYRNSTMADLMVWEMPHASGTPTRIQVIATNTQLAALGLVSRRLGGEVMVVRRPPDAPASANP